MKVPRLLLLQQERLEWEIDRPKALNKVLARSAYAEDGLSAHGILIASRPRRIRSLPLKIPRWNSGIQGHADQQHQRSGWDQWNHNSVPRPAPLPTYPRQYSGNRYLCMTNSGL